MLTKAKKKKCWARGAQKPSRNLWSEILGKADYMRLMFSTATCAERYFFGGRFYWIFQFTFPSEFIAINLEMRGSIRRQQPDQSSRNKFFAMQKSNDPRARAIVFRARPPGAVELERRRVRYAKSFWHFHESASVQMCKRAQSRKRP